MGRGGSGRALASLAQGVHVVVVNVGGSSYDVTSFSDSYNNAASKLNMAQMPWGFGDQALARQFSDAARFSLGFPNNEQGCLGGTWPYSPFFAYAVTNQVNSYAVFRRPPRRLGRPPAPLSAAAAAQAGLLGMTADVVPVMPAALALGTAGAALMSGATPELASRIRGGGESARVVTCGPVHVPPRFAKNSTSSAKFLGFPVLQQVARFACAFGFAVVGIGSILHGGVARAVSVTVNGNRYNVTTLTGSFTGNSSTLTSQVWFGDSTLASRFATQVGSSLGIINPGDYGPLFAWKNAFDTSVGGNAISNLAYNSNFFGVAGILVTPTQFRTYAVAELQPPVNTVPAPLPLFGAMAGFGMSRRLRARIQAASPRRVHL